MAKSVRTTVSVPEELYANLAKAAKTNRVSTAWVIREALRLYLDIQGATSSRTKTTVGASILRSRPTKSRR